MFVQKLSFLFAFLFMTSFCFGQSNVIQGKQVSSDEYTKLYDKFEYFELYEFASADIQRILDNDVESNVIKLRLNNIEWDLELFPHDIRGNTYGAFTEINGKTQQIESLPNITYRGGVRNIQGSDVRWGMYEDMIVGLIRTPNAEYFIENVAPMVEGAPNDLYILYEVSSVIPVKGVSCGADERYNLIENNTPESQDGNDSNEEDLAESGSMGCWETIISLACDAAFRDRHGGTGGAQSRMISILNLVQLNYDDEFRDEIKYLLGPTFIPSGSNPGAWNFGSIGSLLSSFRNWGNGGGFGGTGYDVATMWTARSYGGVIGLAYLTALCGGNRYNICVDYTSNSNGLRNLQAHELGHNFSFTHDPSGSPHIMAPAVNGSNTWSGQSRSQFNNRVPFSCQAACSPGVPPVADFRADMPEGCRPHEVRFTDLSTNTPTQWRWSFPGGSPSSSTQQNPVVIYSAPGTYEVTLEATNAAGTGVETKVSYIQVGDVPITNFETRVTQDEVIFIDRSVVYGAAQYRWDFGDGNFSNDQNPIHIYEKDGTYLVRLDITTACGSSFFQVTVVIITPPEGEFSANPLQGCVGTAVEFMDESSDNVDTWSWQFESGNPGTSSLENPTVVYDTAGTFKVTLVVSNSRYMDKVEKVGYITIDSASVADFSEMVDTLTVNFENESKYGREYKWDFGDGGSSTQENPTHTYAKDSIYEVTLITKNFCDEDTIKQFISVGFLPTAMFSSDKQEDCVTASIDFSDESSDNATRRIWKFEGGTPASSTEANPTVTYDQTGEFKVTLIAINGLGNDTLVEEKYIEVLDVPEGDFDFTRNGFEINFNNQSLGATSYNWDFGDGNTSTDENPTHTYGQDGDYEVKLIVSNICGADTLTKTVSLSNSPNANFTADQTQGCVPMTVQLQNLSSNNSVDFEWRLPGGSPNNTTEANPTVTYNNPGLYRVELIAKNGFGADTVVKRDFIEVLDVPQADFTFQLNGFSIDFTEDSEFGKEFFWDFGDGANSTLENPTHVYTDEGVFEVILIVKNICGEDTISREITVTPRPILAFNVDKKEICKENSVTYQDETENDPTDWLWTFEGGDPMTSTDQNPTVTYNMSGTYDVILEATNAFGTTRDTFQQVVRVYDEPLAAYAYEEQGVRVNFTNNSLEFGSITWDFGDGNTSNEFAPSHLYSLPGTYEVELTIENECGIDSYKEEIQVKHVDITFLQGAPPPAPNPTNGIVNVAYMGPRADVVEVFVSGIDGQLQKVYETEFQTGEMTTEIDLSGYQPGSYMIFFKTIHEVKMSKVVVQD